MLYKLPNGIKKRLIINSNIRYLEKTKTKIKVLSNISFSFS